MARDSRRQREIIAVVVVAGIGALLSDFVLGPAIREKLGVRKGR